VQHFALFAYRYFVDQWAIFSSYYRLEFRACEGHMPKNVRWTAIICCRDSALMATFHEPLTDYWVEVGLKGSKKVEWIECCSLRLASWLASWNSHAIIAMALHSVTCHLVEVTFPPLLQQIYNTIHRPCSESFFFFEWWSKIDQHLVWLTHFASKMTLVAASVFFAIFIVWFICLLFIC